ncbi:pilus assembly protein CpaE [Desertivibrio insolitus]|uniref:pilus assembly protein CpaE n=1 Tax=Herbiconiux sp. SYSU D00978 TaxID=2812562 RepID=UPI001A96237E|nr:pilus assembly protein CpaE [Herbiconiux sp. SYSU D00978]
MISTELARELRRAGLVWKPQSGDRFIIDRPTFDADVFTVSDMTIEAHTYPTGTVLGFNGTTEWALDSVSLGDAVWMPQEHQLRDLLRTAFRSLELDENGLYRVTAQIGGEERAFEQVSAAEAYGQALLALIRLSQ